MFFDNLLNRPALAAKEAPSSMPVSPARAAAFRILQQVEAGNKFAVDLLQSARVSSLKEADRKLATGLVMGVLRWRGDLDHEIETLSGKQLQYFDAEVIEILRMGVFQIRHLEGVPKRAAVNESVELVKTARKRSAAGLVNAVLRKCTESPLSGRREYLEAARRSTPSWMYARWQRNFGQDRADSIALASQSVPRTCIRLKGRTGTIGAADGSGSRQALQLELEREQVRTTLGKYARRALWVESGSVFSSAAWREGRAVIQDEASQLVAEVVKAEPGQSVLDLCAAPGMKASQMAEDMREGAIVACDRSLRRMGILNRIIHTGWPGGVRLLKVMLDAGRPLPFSVLFDRVLVDAPCSGTGTLARNPEIKWRLRPKDISILAERQTRILQHGLELLAHRGRLIYSTCSLEPEENEVVVAKALDTFPGYRKLTAEELRAEFPAFAELFGDDGAFRTQPGEQPMDGFFAAVLMRDEKGL
ncbi:MAG: transcription antitermination factor NusB [Terriglobia bacterium]